MAETSTKPYMLRALHEWCTDNGYTPQIVVQVDANTLVPLAHVRDGQITLNIGALATNRLVIGNEAIEFQARFNGVTEHLYVPINTVSAIYARETGAGMGFEVESSSTTTDTVIDTTPSDAMESVDSPASESPRPTDSKRPRLSIVK
jgi:stringent starvation protein B